MRTTLIPLALGLATARRLAQRLLWDGNDETGRPGTGGLFSVRVRAGMRPSFDRVLLYDPDATPPVYALAVGPTGHVYAFDNDPTANTNQDSGGAG